MAHKTAFTALTLGSQLIQAGFAGAAVTRDRVFGLHALATKTAWADEDFDYLVAAFQPTAELLLERLNHGTYVVVG